MGKDGIKLGELKQREEVERHLRAEAGAAAERGAKVEAHSLARSRTQASSYVQPPVEAVRTGSEDETGIALSWV